MCIYSPIGLRCTTLDNNQRDDENKIVKRDDQLLVVNKILGRFYLFSCTPKPN